MKIEKKSVSMIHDSPKRAILFFALPMIMGNLFQQFYSIMDSVIVGRFVSLEALASVGASYSITNVFIAVAVGGGAGSAVVVSQLLGANQIGSMKTAISTTLINFFFLSVLLGSLGFLLNKTILTWMDTPSNVFQDASIYLSIYFIGLPFLFMYNVQAAVFQSLGDSRTPLFLLIFSSLLNIALNLLFVTGFHLGVSGVAAATFAAQGISAVISFAVLIRRLKEYETKETFRFYDWKLAPRLLRVAAPSTLQQSIVYVGLLLVQSVVNTFGSEVMAGFTAGSRIESVCVVPMLAIGNAMSTFTAQNMGAGKPERVHLAYRYGCAIAVFFAVVICVSLKSWGGFLIRGFIEEDRAGLAFQTGMAYVDFIAFFFVLMGLKAATDGVLRGSGDVLVFTASNLVNLVIRVTAASVAAPVIGVSAVWFAVPAGWAANYLISFLRYLTGRWSRIRLVKQEKAAGG